ncbi:GH12608, partial [Drosophila grimshawi]
LKIFGDAEAATHRFDFNLDLDIQFGASLMAMASNNNKFLAGQELHDTTKKHHHHHHHHDLNVR